MDRYHFNSLYFSAGRLFVLAHNWDYGSFALELEYRGADSLFRSPRVCGVHTGLGRQSHDVYLEDGLLYVLSSLDAQLLASNGAAHRLGLDSSNCRASGQPAAIVDVGPYGNPCNLLLMNEPDWSDGASFPALSGRAAVAGWPVRDAG